MDKCFITTDVDRRIGLVPTPHSGMSVGVVNGDHVTYDGIYFVVSVCINDEHFNINFFVIPLGGYDVVLGCHWLLTLGPIIWDFDRLSMTVWRVDHRVHWVGLEAPSGAHARAVATDNILPLLLAEFSDIFKTPQGLLPARASDHHIHLLSDMPPVVVRPYRYPQFLKDEDENNDIANMAFHPHHVHFEFIVMAFGLTNPLSTFQALMNAVLHPYLHRFVLIFFDDILIYSSF